MTRRKSKRELERAIDDLGGGDEDDGPMSIRIRRYIVDQEGNETGPVHEKVIEYDHSGPNLTWDQRVVETSWEPRRDSG
jgi:hypothetical protein